jgi:signal peptidase
VRLGWLAPVLLIPAVAVLVLLGQPLLAFSLICFAALFVAHAEATSDRHAARRLYATLIARGKRRNREAGRSRRLSRIRASAKRPGLTSLLLPLAVFITVLYILLSNLLFLAVVTSESMAPAFGRGDIVLMQGFDREPREGDIVLFASPVDGRAVIHRVVDVRDGEVLTKGDDANAPDPWTIGPEDIRSKAVQVGGEPMVLEGVGWYFIRNAPPQEGPFGGLRFTRLAVGLLKDVGLAIFFVALALYAALTAKDLYFGGTHERH